MAVSSGTPDLGQARPPLSIRRFAGLGISTAALGEIAGHFTALRSHALFQADGQTFATIDELVDCVIEDMAPSHVFMAVMDDEWRSLLFLYRPETVVVQTDSLQEDYRSAFQACEQLLAAQPPTGTALCDIVVGAAAVPRSPAARSGIGHSLSRWWSSSSAAHRSPSSGADARRR